MALTEYQKDVIRSEIGIGTSNREAARKAGCGESAVRVLIKKEGIEKNAINALAEKQVQTTIIQDELDEAKSALGKAQRNALENAVVDLKQQMNIFNNATVKHQKIINTAADLIGELAEGDRTKAIEQLPNMLGIITATEKNRRQLFGVTQQQDQEQASNGKMIVYKPAKDPNK